MRRLLSLAALLLAALPLFAQNNEIGVAYAGSRFASSDAGDTQLRFRQGHGWSADYNRYWFGGLSTDFAYTTSSNDVNMRFNGVPLLALGSLDSRTTSAAVQWHLAPRRTFDVYAGAGWAWMRFDDLTSPDITGAGIGTIRVEKTSGFMANAGVNWNVMPHVGLMLDGKYIQSNPRATSADDPTGVDLNIKPWIVSAGVRFRF